MKHSFAFLKTQVFKDYMHFLYNFIFQTKSALFDGRTEQCSSQPSQYFTVHTAHRKTKSSILHTMMTINRIHCVFILLTSCLNYTTCYCQASKASKNKLRCIFFQRLWDGSNSRPLCACCESPHWQWPPFTASMQTLCVDSADVSCVNREEEGRSRILVQLDHIFRHRGWRVSLGCYSWRSAASCTKGSTHKKTVVRQFQRTRLDVQNLFTPQEMCSISHQVSNWREYISPPFFFPLVILTGYVWKRFLKKFKIDFEKQNINSNWQASKHAPTEVLKIKLTTTVA